MDRGTNEERRIMGIKYPKYTREEDKRRIVTLEEVLFIREKTSDGYSLQDIANCLRYATSTIRYWRFDKVGRQRICRLKYRSCKFIYPKKKISKINRMARERKRKLYPEEFEIWYKNYHKERRRSNDKLLRTD